MSGAHNMKTYIIRMLCIVAIILPLQSCYSDFDPKLNSDPVLCMNSVLETGSPVKVNLSHTYNWEESFNPYMTVNPSDYDKVSVTDAEISLYINGVLKDVMTYTAKTGASSSEIIESGYYSDYCPAEGDEVKLIAVSKKYGEAEATVVMPERVEIEDIDVTTTSMKKAASTYFTNFHFNQNFSVWFTDPAETVNYYRILVEPVNPAPVPTGQWHETWGGEMYEVKYASSLSYWNINNESEPLFSEHADLLDIMFETTSIYFTVFSDKSIPGKRYPISLRLENANLNICNPKNIESLYDVKLRFSFYSISESYYNWFIYSWYNSDSIQGSLTEIGFAEAMMPPSNVSTNAGIVAACTKSVFDVEYRDFLKENYNPAENIEP